MDIKQLIMPIAILASIVVLVVAIRATLALRGFSMSEARQQIAQLSEADACDDVAASVEDTAASQPGASLPTGLDQPYVPAEDNPEYLYIFDISRRINACMSSPAGTSFQKAEAPRMAASGGLSHPLNISADDNELGAQVMRKRISEEFYPSFEHFSKLPIPCNPAAVDKSVSL